MKIRVFHDYGGRVTGELFFKAGEHTVSENMGIRMIEHGLAAAVVDDLPAPVAPIEAKPDKVAKHGKKRG